MNMKRNIVALAAAALMIACGDSDPVKVVQVEVRGTYDLTVLKFDPQGVLPETDLKTRIIGTIPRLTLANSGQAQLVFQDPETGLITLSNATYSVTTGGDVKLDFGSTNSLYAKTLLSRNMTFDYTEATRTLTFSGTSPDGVTRARLIQLVPEFRDEQLLDPVPGTLTVTFKAAQ